MGRKERLKKPYKKRDSRTKTDTVRRILSYIGVYRWLVLLSLVLAAVTVVLTLYIPILIGDAIDRMAGKGQVDFAGLFQSFKIMIVVIAVTAGAQWLMNIINNHITYRVSMDIRNKAFSHLETLPLKYVDSHQYGDILSRMITDVDQFSDGLLMGFTQLFSGVLTILGTLVFMFSINPVIALVVVFVTPASLLVAGYIAKKTFYLFKEQSEARGELTSLINEIVGNEKVVQAFSYEKEAEERFDKVNRRLERCSLRATFFSSITNPATRFVNGLVYASVGIAGAVSAVYGLLTVGQLTSFLNYANQYTKPFNEISGVVTELQNALASAARVLELMDEHSEIPDDENSKVLSEADGRVKMSNVCFSYNPDVRLIEDLNLSAEPGQRIAIIGPTGCGKSTVINLLMRFYDADRGRIEVSGCNIKDITRSSLRSSYGMVLQETWLKSASIGDNIAYGRPEASMKEIIEAAKKAHAHSFIERMPEGYDTILSEDGGNLSQGQKQLLCIARVMLCRPPMLILDEATSSIDTRTELLVQEAFEKMMEGSTSFIVAHRLSTIQNADRILVMRDGKVVEQGNHEELLAKQGFYYELYHSQFAVS